MVVAAHFQPMHRLFQRIMYVLLSFTFSQSTTRAYSAVSWVRPVYIRSVGSYLPNNPVSNEDIEKHIGELPAKRNALIRDKILSLNGIKQRYYALIDGKPTHLNLDLAAMAVHDALDHSDGITLDDVSMLTTGTTSPDVLVPGFANLLHGRIAAPQSMDCLSSAGVCISSTSALKAAAHSVTLGEHSRALVVGSEAASHWMLSGRFQEFIDAKEETLFDPREAFNALFLRYMLSDGAGCALLDSKPHPSNLSYRIEQFFHHSFAHELPPCMVFGCTPGKRVEMQDISKFNGNGKQYIQQDVALLKKYIVPRCVEALKLAIEQGFLGDDKRVDWVLPHISSQIFFEPVAQVVQDVLTLPKQRIWTNLSSVGNIGAASPMLLLWGALNSSDKPSIKIGDRILLVVPESGNFSYHFVLLTVVDSTG